MVDPEVIVIPIIFGLPTVAIIIKMVLNHREKMAALERGRSGTLPPGSEERLARLENAVEAIAIEMERVGEGQRFLTKVLTERKELTDGVDTRQ